MGETKTTTIRISFSLKDELDTMGSKKDSYEDIIRRLIDAYKRSPEKMNEAVVDKWGRVSVSRTRAGQKIFWIPEKE